MYKVTDILISKEDIDKKVYEIAKKIESDYKGEELLLIGVLKGAFVFISDLIRHIDLDVSLDFMAVSSYGMATKTSGTVKILKDLDVDIENKNILIVEDIIDTGLTLKYLSDNLKSRNPKSMKICTLLDKPERRECHLDIDYVGFEIPDKFIVGYGIDCGEKFRNLPYIGVVGE
ncbi:hypoxanthine phosphoribosyltransferase [Alkalithermobacter paradoxus]|uniref:Hypoxanthine phosphoribosyltransferase n=1 Tax=Alkalithermobacter paradoxus TaxID=29349 RepID=A0A1V4IAD0_9FIRM|nr:hypoxanthine phosphoribosyltransferase [[Clostridium] thermoalcaliphilum]